MQPHTHCVCGCKFTTGVPTPCSVPAKVSTAFRISFPFSMHSCMLTKQAWESHKAGPPHSRAWRANPPDKSDTRQIAPARIPISDVASIKSAFFKWCCWEYAICTGVEFVVRTLNNRRSRRIALSSWLSAKSHHKVVSTLCHAGIKSQLYRGGRLSTVLFTHHQAHFKNRHCEDNVGESCTMTSKTA